MEKEETYMEEIKTRFEKMRELRKEAYDLESLLFNAEDRINRAKECLDNIELFTNTLQKTNTGCGWDVVVCVQDGKIIAGNDFHELYRYKMSNIDDLMNIIEDRLYKELKDSLYYVRESKKEIKKVTE